MRKPNFFILGAPKCGTTSLALWLGAHPQVFLSNPKEPWFFNTDLGPRRTVSLAEYEQLFRKADEGHLVVGEASTIYLRSAEAVQRILDYAPSSQFAVILRNPMDMAVSLHGQYLFSTSEDLQDFEEAWKAQEDRAAGRRIPSRCAYGRLLLYGWMCRLGEQVEHLFQTVGQESVKVLFLDEVCSNPRGAYLEILDFLGLRDDGRKEFPLLNPRKMNRSLFFKHSIRGIGIVKEAIGLKFHTGLLASMLHWNTVPERPPELRNYFSEDIAKLKELTGRRLDGWTC